MSLFVRKYSSWRRQCFQYDAQVGWWHISNTKALLELGGTSHLFRTNTEGLRSDREYPIAAQHGRKRIVLLGDSYTAGDGVSNGERFSDLLESYHPHLDVMNFGLNGTGTDQQALIYETKASHYEHDAVLWCVCVENIIRNMCTCRPSYDFREHQLVYRPKPWFSLTGTALEPHNIPTPKEKRKPDALDDWVCPSLNLPEHPEDPYAIYLYPDRQPWQLMEQIFMRVAVMAGGRPVIIVPLPMAEHYLCQLPPTYMPLFRTLKGKRANIFISEVLPAFTAVPLGLRQEFRFSADPHYTPAAHRVLAEALDNALAAVSLQLVDL